MGKNAAGTRAVRRCEKVGMRFTMEPVVCCGKSDARAMGRKAARKEREGTAEIAAILGDVWRGWYAVRWMYGCCFRFHDSPLSSPASIAASRQREILLRAWAGGHRRPASLARPLSRARQPERAQQVPPPYTKRSEPLGVAAAPACTFSCSIKRILTPSRPRADRRVCNHSSPRRSHFLHSRPHSLHPPHPPRP
jgi:hypothetical protein